ncbi:tRNA lysidine(34) synthetase TilS [Xylophilus ampelinus]|uniref:tRNA(Ile)-lysidine synthase n=1 Tax=Xylophilus ampelinus TaxID=54067 RepID=A0A318SWZ0_9BURK|nr:tRNA lysidine(34) synthetase TilS [Xylophilus ampelinus]MCS4508787.1 tRNA lysidine(34) synthetase TilS [Xylophilus ampelinus]PYE79357.1 tRNA(Ile)-lysidine synthase [Xylophilus ampelinus]
MPPAAASPAFDAAMQRFRPALPLLVAFSGGADSTALLAACADRWPGEVRALHVHHGLQSAADGFEAQCRSTCEQLGVPLSVRRVDARAAPGDSPENAARKARYEAFRLEAGADGRLLAIKSVAIAQHADDQAETLLLALSRGAGLPGLACMPQHWRRDGIDYHRPLLTVPGAAVRAWAAARGLAWVEDPTNADEHFTRNRIRARLLPALDAAFPQFRDTFARSAAHAAEAQSVLAEVAAADLAAVGDPPAIALLQGLTAGRRALVLRHWLRTAHGAVPSATQLAELQRQLLACTTRGHRLHLKVGEGFVRREGPVLGWYNPAVLDPHAARNTAAPQNLPPPAP